MPVGAGHGGDGSATGEVDGDASPDSAAGIQCQGFCGGQLDGGIAAGGGHVCTCQQIKATTGIQIRCSGGGCSDNLSCYSNPGVRGDGQGAGVAGLTNRAAHICNDAEAGGSCGNGNRNVTGANQPAADLQRCLQVQSKAAGGQSGIRAGVIGCVQIDFADLGRAGINRDRIEGRSEVTFDNETVRQQRQWILDRGVDNAGLSSGFDGCHIESIAKSDKVTRLRSPNSDSNKAVRQSSQIPCGDIKHLWGDGRVNRAAAAGLRSCPQSICP